MVSDERVRFGVELDRETDAGMRKLAENESRSKRNFHATLCKRLIRIWKDSPDTLRQLGLIREER